MPGPLHYMQVKTREYLASGQTRSLSLAGHGLYNVLRYQQWEDGCLPSDPAQICRLIGADRKEFDKAWKEVRHLLIATDDCRLRFADVEEQRLEVIAKLEKLAQNGARGGRPRGSGLKANGNQKVSEMETEWKAKSETDKEVDNTPLLQGGAGADSDERVRLDMDRLAEFCKWFQATYPKRGDGNYKWPQTFKLIGEILATKQATAGELKQGLLAFKAWAESGKNANSEYIPTPPKWLEEGGWMDEYPVVLKVEAGGKPATEDELTEMMRQAGIR